MDKELLLIDQVRSSKKLIVPEYKRKTDCPGVQT